MFNKTTNFINLRVVNKVVIALSTIMLCYQAQAFSMKNVVTKAKELSEQAYVEPKSNLSDDFKQLSFSDYL